MPNTWQIIQRQNKSALTVGSVTGGIPAYVEPQLLEFRLYDVDRSPTDDFSGVRRGQVVRCFMRVSDPDNLVTMARIAWNGETVGVGRQYWVIYQDGYLVDASIYHSCRTGSDTPTCSLRYETGEEEVWS